MIESTLSNPVTITFIIVIVAVFWTAERRLLRPLRQVGQGFQALARWLEDRAEGDDEPSARTSLATELSESVSNKAGLEKLSLRVRLYERAWRQNSIDFDGRMLSSVDAEEYFEPHRVLPGGFQWMILRLMPGVLTTMGILGTFVGISIGLARLQSGFRVGADFGPMQEGVLGLMGGMSTAFVTSIFGIVFSLFWIVLDRRVSKRLATHRGAFLDQLQQVFPTADLDALWRYSLQIADDQRTAIKTLATDIATNIVDGLDQSIFAKLAPEVTQMREAFEKVTAANSEIQVEGMQLMVERFSDVLGERMKDQFENLAVTIENICDWQRQTKENLDELLVTLQEASSRQSEMLERSIHAGEIFQNSLADLGKIHELLGTALGGFVQLTGQMHALGEKLGTSEEAIRGAAEESQNAIREAAEGAGGAIRAAAIESGKTIREEVEQSQNAIRSAVEQMTMGLNKTLEEFGNLSSGYRQGFDEHLRSIEGLTDATRAQAEVLDERLRTSMEKFTEDCQRGVGQTFSEFDKNLSQLTSALSGTVQDTNDVMERVRKSLEGARVMSDDVHGATQGLKLGAESLESLVKNIDLIAQAANGTTSGEESS